MNAIFSGVFLIDFTYRFTTAPSRKDYFFRHFGWADLLASLPLAELKFLRIFRLVRVFRLMRGVGGRTSCGRWSATGPAARCSPCCSRASSCCSSAASRSCASRSDAPGANITTASDALWYTIVTISTVGYGDQYPVTNRRPGRRRDDHRRRCRHLRDVHRLPGQPVPDPAQKAPEQVDALTQLRHVLDLPGVTVEDVDRVLALHRDGRPD